VLKKTPNAPERTCIATGLTAHPETMIRFALAPDGIVTPDLAQDLPGRGAWVAINREAVLKASKNGLFARAFKSPARLPENLDAEAFTDRLATMLEHRALSAIGLARKAGEVVVGFDQVKAALKANEVAVLISADDAAEDGASKLKRLARSCPSVRAFSVEALSNALGREGVRHAALNKGPFAKRFLREAKRLEGVIKTGMEVSTGASKGDFAAA